MTTGPTTGMTAREVLEAALARVAPEADLTRVGPDDSLREALDLDSMDFLAVVERVAELTGVSVPESDYLQVDSPAGFVAYLESHRLRPPAPPA